MSAKRDKRLSIINEEIEELTSALSTSSVPDTERASIALRIRQLVAEKNNLFARRSNLYNTTKTIVGLRRKFRLLVGHPTFVGIIQFALFGGRSQDERGNQRDN